jgi:hypothetical protein
MVNCYLTLRGTVAYPELPYGRKPIPIRDQRRQLNGTLRTAHRAVKYEFTLTLRDATEAERSAWLTAAAFTSSATFTDELGVSRTVVVQSIDEPLARTEPAVEGGTSTTGPGYYDLTVVVEEV